MEGKVVISKDLNMELAMANVINDTLGSTCPVPKYRCTDVEDSSISQKSRLGGGIGLGWGYFYKLINNVLSGIFAKYTFS